MLRLSSPWFFTWDLIYLTRCDYPYLESMTSLSLCNAMDPTLSSSLLLRHRNRKPQSTTLFWLSPFTTFPIRALLALSTEKSPLQHLSSRRWQTSSCFASGGAAPASTSEIDMVRTKEGIFAPKQKKVVILWDLDNKPPRGPPYRAAMALRQVAQRFGDIVDMSAYANRHAFIHLPEWVVQERRERKQFDILEHKGLVIPSDPYVCGVCGRKCKTNSDLKKHFKQLHERERQKKLNRMKSLKGKKRQRYKERFISGNHKYNEAARSLITPKVGYGLASELRRAGVFVKTVQDKPQAADWALKRQMQHSMSRGIDWLFLISDDSDFSEMLRRAREAKLGTVVVGDWDRALGPHADLWFPWVGVENGEISDKDLLPKNRRRRESFVKDEGPFSISHYDRDVDGVGDLDDIVDELVAMRTDFNDVRNAAFSDEEQEDWISDEVDEEYMLVNIDDEDTEEEDGFY